MYNHVKYVHVLNYVDTYIIHICYAYDSRSLNTKHVGVGVTRTQILTLEDLTFILFRTLSLYCDFHTSLSSVERVDNKRQV